MMGKSLQPKNCYTDLSFFKANKILYTSLYMNAKCTLQAYQINGTAKHFITGICHVNWSMLGGILRIATSLKSLLCELLDWPSSILPYSKPRVLGEIIAIVFLFISLIYELLLGMMMYSEWPGSKFATLNCTAFGERVGGKKSFVSWISK